MRDGEFGVVGSGYLADQLDVVLQPVLAALTDGHDTCERGRGVAFLGVVGAGGGQTDGVQRGQFLRSHHERVTFSFVVRAFGHGQ